MKRNKNRRESGPVVYVPPAADDRVSSLALAPRPHGIRGWQFAGLLILLGLTAISIDLPLARFCFEARCPDFLRELLFVAESFGNGLSVVFIILTVWVLDPTGRIRVPRIVAAVVLAGLSADLFKLVLGRTRPRNFDLAHGEILETFGPMFPIGTISSAGQSFPSAHTATAVALAVALCWAYPRGRALFVALAAMVALQRVETSAHFLSDTFFGAAIGFTAGCHAIDPRAFFGWTKPLEVAIERKHGQPAPGEGPEQRQKAA